MYGFGRRRALAPFCSGVCVALILLFLLQGRQSAAVGALFSGIQASAGASQTLFALSMLVRNAVFHRRQDLLVKGVFFFSFFVLFELMTLLPRLKQRLYAVAAKVYRTRLRPENVFRVGKLKRLERRGMPGPASGTLSCELKC